MKPQTDSTGEVDSISIVIIATEPAERKKEKRRWRDEAMVFVL